MTAPTLSLARLKSHGELTERRVIDLRFTPDEAAAILNQGLGIILVVQPARKRKSSVMPSF